MIGKLRISDLNAHFTFLPVRRSCLLLHRQAQTGRKFIKKGMCLNLSSGAFEHLRCDPHVLLIHLFHIREEYDQNNGEK